MNLLPIFLFSGVLLLAHGGSPGWNKEIERLAEDIRREGLVVEVAFGMGEAEAIERAARRLQEAGAERAVALPLFISSDSEVMDQIKFALGQRKSGSEAIENHGGKKAAYRRANLKIPVRLMSALNAHPLVAEILLERVRAISKNPEKETIVLVGHGPNSAQYNRRWLSGMKRLASRIQKEGGFRKVLCATLREDAEAPVKEKARRNLRGLVQEASQKGEVLVIPHLIAQGGIEQQIPRALSGLSYKWDGKTLLPHKNILLWVLAHKSY